MCELCDLNNSTDGFILTICNTCNTVLVVKRSHKEEFATGEVAIIKAMFPGRQIRWEMKKIHDHAHCHIL